MQDAGCRMTKQKGKKRKGKRKCKGKGILAAIGIIALMVMIIGVITTSAAPPTKPHTVYGFVFDNDKDKKPVSDEQVILINPNTGDSLQTTTASDGSYTFELTNLPNGYKNGDILKLKVQVRAQAQSLPVDTSIGLQKVDDIILVESPQSKPASTKNPSINPTLTNSSSPEQRRPSSIPEFSIIAIPVGITLLLFFFMFRSKSKRRK